MANTLKFFSLLLVLVLAGCSGKKTKKVKVLDASASPKGTVYRVSKGFEIVLSSKSEEFNYLHFILEDDLGNTLNLEISKDILKGKDFAVGRTILLSTTITEQDTIVEPKIQKNVIKKDTTTKAEEQDTTKIKSLAG